MSANLTLLHTNDMHDRRTVFPFLAGYPRDASTLLLDAGDAIRGSNTVFRLHEPILDLMSRVGYDAQAFGNREFNYVRWVLRRRYRQVKYPFVCANVHDLRGRVQGLWEPTWVSDFGGVRVGVIGLTPVQYPADSPWERLFGFRFAPPLDILPTLVRDLASRVDLVILLSHSGYNLDRRIAQEVEGIHVIVGGHSHHLMREPVVLNGTHIVQTGCFGRFVGRMRLRVGSTAGVEVRDYELLPMPNAEPLPEVPVPLVESGPQPA